MRSISYKKEKNNSCICDFFCVGVANFAVNLSRREK